MKMTKVYDQWTGNPKGIPEDKANCVAEVTDYSGWHSFQCQRKRGYGPNGEYCKQHAKKFESEAKQKDKLVRGPDGTPLFTAPTEVADFMESLTKEVVGGE